VGLWLCLRRKRRSQTTEQHQPSMQKPEVSDEVATLGTGIGGAPQIPRKTDTTEQVARISDYGAGGRRCASGAKCAGYSSISCNITKFANFCPWRARDEWTRSVKGTAFSVEESSADLLPSSRISFWIRRTYLWARSSVGVRVNLNINSRNR
jgi:hypothetical protein